MRSFAVFAAVAQSDSRSSTHLGITIPMYRGRWLARAGAPAVIQSIVMAICFLVEMVVTQKLTRSSKVSAWYGTKDELLAVLQLVIDSYEMERERAETEMRASGQTWEQERYNRQWVPQLTVTENGRDELAGPMEEVLDAAQLKSVSRVVFRYPARSDSPSAHIWFGLSTTAVEVTIDDSDAVRANGLNQAIADRLRTSCPKWSFLVSRFAGIIAVYFLIYILALTLLVSLFAHFNHPNKVLAAVVALMIALSYQVTASSSRLLPKFQILGPAERPRARTFLSTIGMLTAGTILATLAAIAFA